MKKFVAITAIATLILGGAAMYLTRNSERQQRVPDGYISPREDSLVADTLVAGERFDKNGNIQLVDEDTMSVWRTGRRYLLYNGRQRRQHKPLNRWRKASYATRGGGMVIDTSRLSFGLTSDDPLGQHIQLGGTLIYDTVLTLHAIVRGSNLLVMYTDSSGNLIFDTICIRKQRHIPD